MRPLVSVWIALAVALGGGCASTAPKADAPRMHAPAAQASAPGEAGRLRNDVRIEESVRRYANDVRFRLFDSAVNFVEPDLRPQFRAATEQLRTIRFTGVTIEEVTVDELGTTAVATLRWRGHWLQSPFERELRTTQRWRRDVPSHNWYVTPELEALGAKLEPTRTAPPASPPPH